MADATTPNLGLVKIGVGGSRDSWGDKLNGNMDTIDAAVQSAVADADAAIAAAGAALPKAGGPVTGNIVREGAGVLPYFAGSGITGGRIFIAPASGSDPTSQPGDVWLGY